MAAYRPGRTLDEVLLETYRQLSRRDMTFDMCGWCMRDDFLMFTQRTAEDRRGRFTRPARVA